MTMSWENMMEGPEAVLTKHHRLCELCGNGFWQQCEQRNALMIMSDVKVLTWQEGMFSKQGWDVGWR